MGKYNLGEATEALRSGGQCVTALHLHSCAWCSVGTWLCCCFTGVLQVEHGTVVHGFEAGCIVSLNYISAKLGLTLQAVQFDLLFKVRLTWKLDRVAKDLY